ncbi:MAG: LacI family DNA-binding transcriptional regulator [Alphaproteobacteria bacterium]|nr:LacI family DNA-binding transcriptional regulator [Alphaproteobacteria bacterium]MDE2495399.1 LacI family DNA-binding transcriptional regulator [Alphaproteobacteria bacterium]
MTLRPEGKSRRGKTQKIATIYDVARRAYVSKTTVSRVVNGEANVREETRDAVLKAVKALQFRPNKAARSLASAAEARIGVVYCNPSVAYFNELLIGALDGSGRNGMQLVVDKCEIGDVEAAITAVRYLVHGGLNGMVLTAPISESRKLIAELVKAGVAVVSVATGGFRGEVSCVGIDDCKAAYEMTSYLLKLGHRQIGFIKGHPSHTSSTQRSKGFEQALRETECRNIEPMVVQGYFSYRSGLDAAEKLLSGRTIPTAIFASNDEMASAAMSVAHRKGLYVPRDLSIVGFDDTIAGSVWPQLTTIRQPIYDIASTAIDIIADNIRSLKSGVRPKPRNHQVPHTLIERESTAPPPPER